MGNQKGQSRETGSIGYTRRRKTKQKHNTIRSVICDTINTIITEQDTLYSILVFKIKVTKIRLLIYMLIYIIEHLTLDLSDCYYSQISPILFSFNYHDSIAHHVKYIETTIILFRLL
jgi:hypothetical protein